MEIFDVAVIGGGPAGSVCAAFCAATGLSVVLIERERFPREKVCGDCLNPECWPILRRLGIDQRVRVLPHGALDWVEFINVRDVHLRVDLPRDFGNRVVLQLLPGGYSGQAPVNDTELNLCLVGRPKSIRALQHWATQYFNLGSTQTWRTITPLMRSALPPARENVLFVGDAARVVEPFTGEGIFYAF